MNREVLADLVKFYGKSSLGGKLVVYDGRTTLYTAGPLPFEAQKFVVKMVLTADENKGRSDCTCTYAHFSLTLQDCLSMQLFTHFKFTGWRPSLRSQFKLLEEQTSTILSSSCVDDRGMFLRKPHSFSMLCSRSANLGSITGTLMFLC